MAVCIFAFFFMPQCANASLMAYEGFNYATGNLTSQNGGFGWNGAWQTVVSASSSVSSANLTAAGRAPSGYDSRSIGRSAFTPNGTRTGRPLDISAGGAFGTKGYRNGSGNIGASGKTIYISFMQQPNIANNNYYEFELHRGDLNDPGRVGGVGCDIGGSSSVYLRTPSANQTLIGPASTAVSFYVVRIDFLGGNDTVRVYQNPTSATEPGSPTLTKTGAGDMSFNGISFGAFVNGATVAHDEVRIGETWADVVSPGGNWTGGGANNYWSTGGNWDNGAVPVFPASLTFSGSTRLNNTNDLTGVSANSITFDSAAGAFTLAGNSLGLSGNISFNGNPPALITQSINLPLTATANFTSDLRANGNISIGGNVAGTNSTLTQISAGNVGILTLGGTNSFAGFIVNGGTNRITGNTAVIGTGGTQFYLANANSSFNSTLVIESGANFSVGGTMTDAGVIGRDSGVGKVVQNGGTFSFNLTNNPALIVGAGNNSNTRGTYNMSGGVLDMNGNTLGIALGAGVLVTGVVNQVDGVITNVGQLYFNAFFAQGHGIYNLTGGSIYIGSGGITNFAGSGYEIYLGGGMVGAFANWSSALNMTLTGSNGPVTFNPAGNTISLSGILSGTGGLAVSGGGALVLSGANTYTGSTTINAGTLTIGGSGQLNSGIYAGLITNNGTFNYNSSAAQTNSGVISGTGALVQRGAGTLTLSGANTYTGNTTISNGTMALSGSGAIAGSPTITVNGGATFDVSAGSFTLGPSQTLKGNGSVKGAAIINGTIAPGASIGTLTLSNSPTLNGTNLMEINATNAQTADKLVLTAGTLTYGGTLTVTNIGNPLVGGEIFTNFSASSYAGAFSATNLPGLGAGLNWYLGNLTLNGTLMVNKLVVSNAVYTRAKGVSLKIKISDLLTNVSSLPAGGDAFVLASVGASTNGATISTNSTYIFFTPGSGVGSNMNESFAYTVKDTRGGSVSGTININVIGAVGAAQAITVAGGTATVEFAGIPGYAYAVQRSTNLVDWATLLITNTPSAGLFNVTDDFNDIGGPPSSAYYRIAQP